jgi:hypothetical protein
MSVSGGRAKVTIALKDLMTKWTRVHEHWHDDVSRAFDERTLQPLEGQVRTAMTAMDKMREVLHRVKSECSARE